MKLKVSVFVVAVLTFACGTPLALGQSEPKKPIVQTQSTTAPGRHQIVMNPNVRADTFLLDTQTGRIWTRVEITNAEGNPSIWRPEERMDNDQQFLEWSKRQIPKKPN